MKFFMTGATGFVGGAVARQLAADGHEVSAVVRSPDQAKDLAALGVRLTRGDVTDKASLRKPMTGADGVFHIAGWYKVGARDKSSAVGINVDGTRHVLELMEELGIAKGVYTSTLAVNSDTGGRLVDETYEFTGRHLTVYDQTKADAHKLARSFMARGLPLVIVQPGLVYGPGDTSAVRPMLLQFLQRKLPMLPAKTAFSWAHVEDVARGHVLAMEKGRPGTNYFVCGPVHTMVEAMRLATELTGIPGPRLSVPPAVMRAAASLMGVVEKVLPVPAAYTYEGLRILAGVTYIGANAKARQELGWIPRPLRDGLAATLRHEMALLNIPAPPNL